MPERGERDFLDKLLREALHTSIPRPEVGSEDPFYEIAKRLEEAAALDFDDQLEAQMRKMDDVFHQLEEREQLVLRRRLGLDNGTVQSQASLAREMGYSPRTIGRLEKKALRNLRELSGFV